MEWFPPPPAQTEPLFLKAASTARRGSGTVAEGDEDEDVLAVVFTWPW